MHITSRIVGGHEYQCPFHSWDLSPVPPPPESTAMMEIGRHVLLLRMSDVIVSQTIIKKFRRRPIENVTFRINHTRIKCNQT